MNVAYGSRLDLAVERSADNIFAGAAKASVIIKRKFFLVEYRKSVNLRFFSDFSSVNRNFFKDIN